MAILNRDEIRRRFEEGQLIDHPRRNENGDYDIEPASYDLTAGVVIWKEENDRDMRGSIQTRYYDPALSYQQQPSVTLQPGQMMFVITHEELLMPTGLCATVYSRNKLARDGILALNAGHIDPGYCGPIAIRLINLRAIPYSLRLGDAIYTIVFHELLVSDGDHLPSHRRISKDETIARYTESANAALSNALHDLSLTQDFVRRNDFGETLWRCLKRNLIKVIALIAGIIVFIATILATVIALMDWYNKIRHP